MSDLELTVDTLKSSLRDTQRTINELRAEADARRQELADLQIAKAQLEGHVREAERRLAEARHVIDLQREELAGSRSTQGRTGRTGATLQHQVRPLQKQVSKVGTSMMGEISPITLGFPLDGQLPATTVRGEQEASRAADGAESAGGLPKPVSHVLGAASVDERQVLSQSSTAGIPTRVLVKSGDTLWGMERKFHIPVERLRAINALANDRIRVGQILRLTESPAGESEREHL